MSDAKPPAGEVGPLRSFWPYVEVNEQPSLEELAALDPDLHDALFGPADRPFSFTIVFSKFDGPEYEQAVAIARQSAEHREVGDQAHRRHRARFLPSDAKRLHALFDIVGRLSDTEVLVDDRPVPYARELWLPLLWFLIPR